MHAAPASAQDWSRLSYESGTWHNVVRLPRPCRGFPVQQFKGDRLGLVLAYWGLALCMGRLQVSQVGMLLHTHSALYDLVKPSAC